MRRQGPKSRCTSVQPHDRASRLTSLSLSHQICNDRDDNANLACFDESSMGPCLVFCHLSKARAMRAMSGVGGSSVGPEKLYIHASLKCSRTDGCSELHPEPAGAAGKSQYPLQSQSLGFPVALTLARWPGSHRGHRVLRAHPRCSSGVALSPFSSGLQGPPGWPESLRCTVHSAVTQEEWRGGGRVLLSKLSR